MSVNKIIQRTNTVVTEAFENGAMFERNRLANFVKQWILEHASEPKYWDDYAEVFNDSIFAEDLKNVILENK